MKVVVVGPGALGCLLAAHLGRYYPTWLLDHLTDRAALLNKQGVVLEQDDSKMICPVRVTSDPDDIPNADLVLLCVKSPKVEEAVARNRSLLNRVGLILALQNGISHLEVLPGLLDKCYWGLGVTAQGATLVGRGHFQHRGRGLTRIGWPPSGAGEKKRRGEGSCKPGLGDVALVMTKAGIDTEVADDILPHIWGKLLVNVGINALTAIRDCPNGALLESADTRAVLSAAVQEGLAVASKIGIRLERDPVASALEICQTTRANLSSMLQDVRAGRLTEIDSINGALVRQARMFGIPTPVNEDLVRQVRELERNYHDFS